MDVKTLLIALLVTALTTNLCIVILYWTRRTYPGFGLWVLGNFSRMGGILLFLLPRDLFPPWLTIILANYLLLASILLNNRGLLIFRDRQTSYGWEIAASLSFCALFAYFTYVDPNVAARVVVFGFWIGAVEIWTAVILMTQRPVYFGSSDRLQAISLVILAAFYLIRSGYTLTFESPLANHPAALPWAEINILIGIFTTILLTLSQIMMNVQRVEYDSRMTHVRLQQEMIQHQQVEAALQESENHYQRMVATVPGMLYDYILYPDYNNRFLYVGPSCRDILELNEKDLLADMRLFWNMVHKEDVQRLHEEDVAANREGRTFCAEVRIVTQSGRLKWIQLSSRPTQASLGKPVIWSGFLLDITERKQAEEQLRIALHRLDTLVAHLHTGVLLVSKDGRVEFANQMFCDLFGLAETPDRLRGLSSGEMLQKIQKIYAAPEDALARVQDIVARGQPVKGEEMAVQGGRCYLREFVPIFIDGQRAGRLWQHLDITERKQAETMLNQTKMALEEAQHLARLGSWQWGIATDTVIWSEEMYRIFNRDPNRPPPTYQEHPQIYTAESMTRLDAAVAQARDHGTPYAIDLELIRPDGSTKWVIGRGEPQYDAQRQVIGLRGTCMDITDRKRMEETLRLSLADTERHNLQMIALNRMDDRLLACETRQEAHKIIAESAGVLFDGYAGGLAVKAETAPDLHLVAGWGEDHRLLPQFSPPDCWALRRGEPYEVTDPAHGILCQHFATPPEYPYLCLPLIVRDEILGLLHVSTRGPLFEERFFEGHNLVVKVSESIKLALSNLHLREALREQAIRDPLTGLFNRRYLDETLHRELHRCQRNHEPLAVAMLDIDLFKHFNDAHGHDAGDAVLRAMGDLLKGFLRADDIACRYGGEELTVILPGATLDDARMRLDSLRCAIKQLRVLYKEDDLPAITVSMGVAAAGEQEVDAAALLGRADAALYQAKESGRNRVVV